MTLINSNSTQQINTALLSINKRLEGGNYQNTNVSDLDNLVGTQNKHLIFLYNSQITKNLPPISLENWDYVGIIIVDNVKNCVSQIFLAIQPSGLKIFSRTSVDNVWSSWKTVS